MISQNRTAVLSIFRLVNKMPKELPEKAKEKIGELQMLQQRLTLFNSQRQQFQIQLAEVENALGELAKAKAPVYKMVGELLVEKQIDDLKKELADKKEELDLRVKTLEKQEGKIKESALALQKEVQAALK
jgi:prefoldin beta subunit